MTHLGRLAEWMANRYLAMPRVGPVDFPRVRKNAEPRGAGRAPCRRYETNHPFRASLRAGSFRGVVVHRVVCRFHDLSDKLLGGDGHERVGFLDGERQRQHGCGTAFE